MPKKVDPNEFTPATLRVLANRAAQTCSNPKCHRPTSGPHSDKNKSILVGEGAHIAGKSPGSARYADTMAPEQRRDISNGIWLCKLCHKLIDGDEKLYTVELLKKWKKDIESMVYGSILNVNDFKRWGSSKVKIIISNNSTNQHVNDIYIKDEGKSKVFFVSVRDLFQNHYHNSEYINGNLFLICRTGGEYGYKNNPNWEDELWKYDQNKKAKMIFSGQGLDFRVSPQNNYVAISIGKKNSKSYESLFCLITDDGKEIIRLDLNKKLHVQFWNIIGWSKNTCWLSIAQIGPYVNGLISINSEKLEINKYSLPEIVGPDMAFSPESLKIIFSDHPAFFDVDDAKEFERSGTKVNLYLYDLVKNTTKIIATSKAKKFAPKWKNKSQFEYKNPKNNKMILKHV